METLKTHSKPHANGRGGLSLVQIARAMNVKCDENVANAVSRALALGMVIGVVADSPRAKWGRLYYAWPSRAVLVERGLIR